MYRGVIGLLDRKYVIYYMYIMYFELIKKFEKVILYNIIKE